MSTVEIDNIVKSIVTVFNAAASHFQAWREKSRGRRRHATNDSIARALRQGPPEIEAEYDRDLASIGVLFARGDGTQNSAKRPQIARH